MIDDRRLALIKLDVSNIHLSANSVYPMHPNYLEAINFYSAICNELITEVTALRKIAEAAEKLGASSFQILKKDPNDEEWANLNTDCAVLGETLKEWRGGDNAK